MQWTVTVQQYNQFTNDNNNNSRFKLHLELLGLTVNPNNTANDTSVLYCWLAFNIEFMKDSKLHLTLTRAIQLLDGWNWIETKADGWTLSIGQSVLTHLQGPLECPPPKHLNIAGVPGDDIPGHVSTAVSNGLDLGWLQNSVPNIYLTQLTHKGLSRIKVPAHHIL